jgi:polyisoprenoid-binding protein YceI
VKAARSAVAGKSAVLKPLVTFRVILGCLLPAWALGAGPATEYRIDPHDSAVSIYVYNEGPLARFGHDHVLTTSSLSGSVSVRSSMQQVDLELSFPVTQLTADDPGVRRKMLRGEVLDAQDYPTISLQSVSSSGPLQSPLITVRLTIRGVSRDTPVPAAVQFEQSSLVASGEFDILQSDFGITPFSIAFGALRVDDRLHVKFTITARAASPP